VISVSLEGLEDAIAAVRGVPSLLNTRTAFDEAGRYLSSVVREATPPGYTANLQKSVTYEAGEESLLVGYEDGVATAGDDKYDSVTRPRTQGRSVVRRRWVKRDELSVILSEAVDDGLPEALSVIERSVSRGIS
jgi:hypothetical protein